MSNFLKDSWGSFSPDFARSYLKDIGNPKKTSLTLLTDALRETFGGQEIRLIDLGCGNAQILDHVLQTNLMINYTGVDFSESLMDAATKAYPDHHFIVDDVNSLSNIGERYDVALYSHVVELLEDPEKSLTRAAEIAKYVVIRFYEPPDFDTDSVELRYMDVGGNKQVPFLRRKMGRDFYRMILSKMGAKRVEVYSDECSADKVHVIECS